MSLSSWSQTSAAMFPSPSKRLVRSKSGLRVVAQHERGNIPWHLEEPHWVKDEEVTQCIECKAKFDFMKRRHHCRRCGRIFCGKCCHAKVDLHRMGFVDPVRLCDACAQVTRAESKFFAEQLKVLFTGAPFHLRSSATITSDSFLYAVRLSQDERNLLFDEGDGGGEPISPVDLTRVVEVVSAADGDEAGSATVRVRETATDDLQFVLECPQEPSRKPSLLWLAAFKKGMEMVFESRSICRDSSPASVDDDGSGGGGGGQGGGGEPSK